MAHAATIASRVPPDPIITSMPDPGHAAIIASPTSPSLTIATRAPRARRRSEQCLVPGPVEEHHGDVLDLHVHREGDAAEVVLRRVVDVDGAARLRPDRDLVHVGDWRREQDATGLGGDRNAERLAEPARDQADAVDGEHGEVDAIAPTADGPAGDETVVGAFGTDDDAALEGHSRQRVLHRRLTRVTGAALVTSAQPATHREGRRLGRAKQLEAAVATP